ncbi:MAG TPA: hypothetical protein PKY81_04980 [bacterium]|nr:hypothetical protein [bacterium]HPN30290.1 hypothetical protein [bacterium]
MALNAIEDVCKVEELLSLKNEFKEDSSLKAQIIQEGVKSRLTSMLALQTTELGRIESNPPEFTETYLREQDASAEIKQKYQFNKEKKVYIIPMNEFLKELKISYKNKIQKEIDIKQTELEKIMKMI